MLLKKNQEFWNLLTSTKVQEKLIGGLPFASVSYDFLPYSNGNLVRKSCHEILINDNVWSWFCNVLVKLKNMPVLITFEKYILFTLF